MKFNKKAFKTIFIINKIYNIINNIKKQCIIVTKDFITAGKVRTKDLEGLDCPIYRIKKAEGFDPNNMATIRTTIERIK